MAEQQLQYLLLTHVPTYAGQSPGVVRVTDAFRHDLLAQATALRQAGFELTLATPRHDAPDAKALSREQFVDVRLADHGITDAPLPAYRTMPQFVAARSALEKAIVGAAKQADVAQMGAGGHPTALGQVAWPLVDPKRSKRIFVFAGDPLPGRRRAIVSGRNPAKRLAKGLAVRAFEAFCRQAVREADLVFAHDPAVQKRFARDWSGRCHTFGLPPMGDADLAGPRPVAQRQKRLAEAKRALRLIAVGDAVVTGGMDHLLQALAKARRLGATWTLAVAGPTPARAVRQLADSLDLGHVVTWDAEWSAEADAADAFIAAPLVPGENPTIYLAAGRGLPIITYQSGPADAALTNVGGAVGVERGDKDLLAQALLDLGRDRDRLATLAAAARDWAAGVTRDGVHRARAGLVRGALES
ncbi:MAG TPA: glycosyltransferase [Tepidisphaeraceae bacterium]